MAKNKIVENIITKKEITITDDYDYQVKFVIDEQKKSLTVIDDSYKSYFYQWYNIGNQTFTEFLISVSKYYLGCKIFKETDYVLDLPKAKKYFKEIAIRHFRKGLTKEERGNVLSEINEFDGNNATDWYYHISSIWGIEHYELDSEDYATPTKLNANCERILKKDKNER